MVALASHGEEALERSYRKEKPTTLQEGSLYSLELFDFLVLLLRQISWECAPTITG